MVSALDVWNVLLFDLNGVVGVERCFVCVVLRAVPLPLAGIIGRR
jgi:hypothetical protein